MTIKAMLSMLLLLVLTAANRGAAQNSAESHARNACRLAQQVLATGHPAPQMHWAVRTIADCGPEGGAAAGAFLKGKRSAVAASDSFLNALVESVWGMQDQALLAAALEVAADGEATDYARIQALRVLFSQVRPTLRVGIREIANPLRLIEVTADATISGPVLPTDFRQRIRMVTSAIANNASLSGELREAASFVRNTAEDRSTPP